MQAFLADGTAFVHLALAKTKRRIVEKGTPMSKLMHAHPDRLDISRLETTPFEQFDVMGETTLAVSIKHWRLVIDGDVDKHAEITYQQLLQRSQLERNALLVCSGFFAYNGFWTGFSIGDLLAERGIAANATHIRFTGSRGFRKRKERYEIDEVLSDKVFAAYRVNGRDLPARHGFPLRLVAVNHRGSRWLKYLNRITVETR